MAADLLLTALLRAQAAAALAIVLVLVLRGPARRLIGAELTYRLWATPPIAAAASLFPTLSEYLALDRRAFQVESLLHLPHPELFLGAWGLGAAAAVGAMLVSDLCFRRLARAGKAGPAVMGVLWPRLVTPADYAERFTAAERELIERHERAHIARHDPRGNLFIAACQAVSWFNPLVHLAADAARLDQELACDADVVEARPQHRRAYAETLIKAHASGPRPVLASALSVGGRHPLETRLGMLARPALSLPGYVRGAAAVGLVAAIVAAGVWAFAPTGVPHPSFVWPLIIPAVG